MKKRNALLAFTLADVLAIEGLWSMLPEIPRAYALIQTNAEYIKISSNYLIFIGVTIPLVHLLVFMECYGPTWIKKIITDHGTVIGKAFVVLSIGLVILGFGFAAHMRNVLEENGYSYCRKASRYGHLASFLVYVHGDSSKCGEVAAKLYPDGNPYHPFW